MRRKYLAIGFALITLSAAAAVAILPQNGVNLRGNLPFLPADLWSPSDRAPAPSAKPAARIEIDPLDQPSNPFSVLDLPFDTAKIYVADYIDDPLSDDPASQPIGGEGQTAKGAGPKSNDGEDTNGTTNDDGLFGSIFPGNGFAARGGGGFTTLAFNETSADEGSTANDGGGGGGGGGGASNGNPENLNNTDPRLDSINTGNTETPAITVDEPAPLSLLLVGGLALFLARRAKRRAAR